MKEIERHCALNGRFVDFYCRKMVGPLESSTGPERNSPASGRSAAGKELIGGPIRAVRQVALTSVML